MSVTVKDLVQLALPQGTRVLAGRGGLTREVAWARSLRPRPPAFEALEGGELALVSTAHLSLLEEGMTLEYILARLEEVQVAAVAVLGEVSKEAIALAETLGLPLLQLPETASLAEVERAAIATVVDRQAELQRRATEIYRRLSQLTLEDRGLQAVTEKLAEITGKTVTIEDDQFRVQYGARGSELPGPDEIDLYSGKGDLEQWVRGVPLSGTQPPVARFSLDPGTLSRYVAPVVAREGVVGYLSVIGHGETLTELDRMAASRAAAVSAVEVTKEAAVGEAEARMRGDLLDQLLSPGVLEDQALLGKARRMGYDPTLASVVVTFKAIPADTGDSTAAQWGGDRVRRRLESLVRVEMSLREPRALVASRGNMVVAVIPLDNRASDRPLRELAEGMRAKSQAALGGYSIATGIGRSTLERGGLAACLREAERALAIGSRVNGPSSTTYFGDLGILRLLAQVSSVSELEGFRQEMLGSLEAHDRRSGGELARTLEAFFRCHGNLTRTAGQLSLHRNSLLYRLQRIEEITGHDLEDPETRLSLQAALKVRQLLEAEKPRKGQLR